MMIKLKLTVVLYLVMLLKTSVAQNDTLKLTLTEAHKFALAHNKELQNAKADILLANAQYKETRSQGLPHLDGNLNYMTNFNYKVKFEFAPSGETTMPDINTAVLDEGDFEILDLLNQMFAPSDPATIAMTDQANAQVTVSQLIFNGQFWVGLKIADIYKKLSKIQLKRTENEVIEQVTNTYYLILATRESLEIINKNLTNLKSTLNHTKNMYNAGLLEKYDVDQLRMNVSQLENSREATRRNLQLTYNMLKIQLGLEPHRNIILTDHLSTLIEEAKKRIPEQKLVPSTNISYQLISFQEVLHQKQVDLEKWGSAPTLTGYYSYTEKLLTTDFDLSPKNAAGLNLSIPIYSGGSKKAKISTAKVNLDKTLRNKSLLEDQLHLQEVQLKYNLQSALDNYTTQKENVAVAERVYNSIFNKYKQGLVSSLDLTQANNNYLKAENTFISSILEVLQSILALDRLYNNL